MPIDSASVEDEGRWVVIRTRVSTCLSSLAVLSTLLAGACATTGANTHSLLERDSEATFNIDRPGPPLSVDTSEHEYSSRVTEESGRVLDEEQVEGDSVLTRGFKLSSSQAPGTLHGVTAAHEPSSAASVRLEVEDIVDSIPKTLYQRATTRPGEHQHPHQQGRHSVAYFPALPSANSSGNHSVDIPAVSTVGGASTPSQPDERTSSQSAVIPHAGSIQAQFASIDDARKQLPLGPVVFNVPTPVDIDDDCPCRIDVVVSASGETKEVLEGAIKAENPLAKNFQSANIRISPRMAASLTASPDDFEVSPKGDQEQDVGLGEAAKWTWTIVPKTWGPHVLTLTMKANVMINGKAEAVSLKTFSRPLIVAVTPFGRAKHFVTEHLEFAWGSLLVPFFGFLAWLWKRGHLKVEPTPRKPRRRP